MAKLADRIREELKPHLELGEDLRSVGQVTSGSMSTVTAMLLTTGIGYLFIVKNWHVGITQKRAIFLQLTAFSKPKGDVRFSVPLEAMKLGGKGLLVSAAQEGLPQEFRFYFGARRLTGLDVDEFKEALRTPENIKR